MKLQKLTGDNRHRQGDDEGASDGTDGADHSAHHSLGSDVTVAHSRHGDGRPPEGVNDAGEGGGGLVPLGHVGEGAEYQNSNTDEHQDQDELLV